ncbi:MAG: hypothetical protein EOP41_06110, partial [Sphingobacteriaceae bacterium]
MDLNDLWGQVRKTARAKFAKWPFSRFAVRLAKATLVFWGWELSVIRILPNRRQQKFWQYFRASISAIFGGSFPKSCPNHAFVESLWGALFGEKNISKNLPTKNGPQSVQKKLPPLIACTKNSCPGGPAFAPKNFGTFFTTMDGGRGVLG